jgi:hypothetical protein
MRHSGKSRLVPLHASTCNVLADYSVDVVPGSLRVDSQHLSSGGYRIVAQQVAQFIRRHGW